jgi:hypothetical protein
MSQNPSIAAQQWGNGSNKSFPTPFVPANCSLAVRVGGTYVDWAYSEDRSQVILVDAPGDRVLCDFLTIPKTFAQ